MILIKLGGSVITDKSEPLAYREKAVASLAATISHIISGGEGVMVVHGGGSFGHYFSVRYDMHTEPARYDMAGVAAVKNSMVHLNGRILETMSQNGLWPYCYPPTIFVPTPQQSTPPESWNVQYPPHLLINYDRLAPHPEKMPRMVPTLHTIHQRAEEIQSLSDSGMCPVTFGDAMWSGEGQSYILSGDTIMVLLAGMLHPRLAIFAMDVNGLYTTPDSGDVIDVIDAAKARDMAAQGTSHHIPDGRHDVTGGMRRKLRSAASIADMGIDTLLVNGNMPDRISAALKGQYQGTLMRGEAA